MGYREPAGEPELIEVLMEVYRRAVKELRRRWGWVVGVMVLVGAGIVVGAWPRPADVTRSRLAPGQEVVLYSANEARVTASLDSEEQVELVSGTTATVVSDAIPDAADQKQDEKGGGFGPLRPVKVKLTDGAYRGREITILRGGLRPAG